MAVFVNLVLIGLAVLRLVLAIVFAVAGLYIASWVLGKLTKGLDEWKRLVKATMLWRFTSPEYSSLWR